MIVDDAKVSLFDGTYLPAVEVYPGKHVLSFGPTRKVIRGRVLDRKIENQTDVISLILSNGQKLTASRDQVVAVYREKHIRFTPLSEVSIGDRLRGERAGVLTIVAVVGLAYDLRKEVRLVGLQLDKGKNFVAQGVLCR